MGERTKQLLILRHAKSSWSDPGCDDHDRPLNSRGVRDAPRMGRLLRDEGLVPDGIVSSTATRARETALAVGRACGYEGDVRLTTDLYLAAPGVYIECIATTPADVDRLMLVGHNPGLEQLLALLTGADESLSTAALAVVDTGVADWHDVRPGAARLASGWRPKQLPPEDRS